MSKQFPIKGSRCRIFCRLLYPFRSLQPQELHQDRVNTCSVYFFKISLLLLFKEKDDNKFSRITWIFSERFFFILCWNSFLLLVQFIGLLFDWLENHLTVIQLGLIRYTSGFTYWHNFLICDLLAFALVLLIGSSLSVSGRVHSASALNQRGVSYPPPSPRGLTRAQPVPQSRNPPLVKTRRLASVAGLINVNISDSTIQHSATVEATNPNVDLRNLTSTLSWLCHLTKAFLL